jgi:Flp pilus assembly secretin CpaC
MPTKLTALAIAFAVFVTTISLTRAADKTVILEIGTKGMTLMLEKPFKAILIGDPDVVDVLTQGDRLATLQPQGLGATNIIFLDEGNIAIANFRVVVCKTGAKNISFNEQANCERIEIERKSPT